MEVHAHTHTTRKKWTHYFWEFLMLFLAVFCGFLAEYQLEHKIEKDRARQYVFSFYNDLAGDTARLFGLLNSENKKIEALSRMNSCYAILLKDPTANTCFFELIKNSSANSPGNFNDKTLRQLSNAGGYRTLKREDADSIMSYESMLDGIRGFNSTAYQEAQENLRNTFSSIIEFSANTKLYRNITVKNWDYNDEVNFPLLFTNDRTLLNKYFNELFQYLKVTVGHRNRIKALKEKVTTLILYFKQKYHLD